MSPNVTAPDVWGRAASSEKCLCDASNPGVGSVPCRLLPAPAWWTLCSAEQALLALPTAVVVKLVLDSTSADVERGF